MYPPCFVMPIFGIRVGVYHHIGSFCVSAATQSGGKERQGLYMRKFKTAAKNRTNYIYYTAEGKPIVITPGMVGEDGKAVTESLITMLHDWDDDDVDAERHEEYHCPVHYDGYHDGDGDDADDRNPYFEDETYNPLQQILTSIANEERSLQIEKLKVALSQLTDKQKDTVIKKFYRGMTNVQIAAEEGVSEAAIRNRLTKIYATLKKKI